MTNLNPIPDDTTNAALKPTAKAIGDASGSIFTAGFNLILTPLRKYNIRKEQELTDYANRINNHIENIPIEHRDSSKVNLVLKAVDDSKFRLDDSTMREAFARLIANALDQRVNQNFYPSYSDILANMSPNEAVTIKQIYQNFGSAIPTITPQRRSTNNSGSVQISEKAFIFDDHTDQSPEIGIVMDLLWHSGLINMSDINTLAHDHFIQQYDKFETQSKQNQNLLSQIVPDTELTFKKGMIGLTTFGKSFTKLIN